MPITYKTIKKLCPTCGKTKSFQLANWEVKKMVASSYDVYCVTDNTKLTLTKEDLD